MNTIHIHIVGPVGCGKSALAGEVEILCKALGLSVSWPDSQSEKSMTGADCQSAPEMYKPSVIIHESGASGSEAESAATSGEAQSYRDADDMPTERAVLEREWLAMRHALSYRQPQPQQAVAEGAGDVSKAVALYEAVSAIYFDDSSDFKPALLSAIRALSPEMEEMLRDDPRSAWQRADEAKDAALATKEQREKIYSEWQDQRDESSYDDLMLAVEAASAKLNGLTVGDGGQG